MRCPWSSLLLAGATLVSTGAWWSWTIWTDNQSLKARLESVETSLAALAARFEVNDRNKGVTAEPMPGQNVLPKSLPRRLSMEKEVAVASPDLNAWKTYITHGRDWWELYFASQAGPKSEEEGCEEFVAHNPKLAPACQDMSVIDNVTKYAMDGKEERLFSLLEKHPDQPELKDLALAAAAFGQPVLLPQKQFDLDGRKEVVRRLFTDGAFGNASILDVGFELVHKKVIDVDPALLRLLAWGTLRSLLVSDGAKWGISLSWMSLRDFVQKIEKYGHGGGVPLSVLEYAIDHPECLHERSSEDRTLLMEAASLHSCSDSHCLDPLKFNLMKRLYEELGVSFTAMDEDGKNAAMLAAQHGALDKAMDLQEAMLEEEKKEQPWIYHSKFMLSFVLVLHMALASVTLLFDCCSGGPPKWWLVRDFLMKTSLLTACNVLIQYLVDPQVLLNPKAMMEIYYNIHMPHAWPIFALLTAIFIVYTIYDFKDVVRLGREGCVVQSVQAVNVYQDPKVSILTCMHTFLLSCVFICVYWNKVVGPVQMNLFTRFCWAFSLFVQYYLSSRFRSSPEASEGLEPFGRWAVCLEDQSDNNLWAVLLNKGQLSADGGPPAPLLSRPEVLLRFFMDYVANGFFRILILYSLPVYLATSEQASDFALNAFAVTFISELDNLSETAEYQIEGYKSLES